MRGHGEGSIYQRESDGRWVGSVTLKNGKRRVFYGKRRSDVAEKMKTALADQQQGRLMPGSRRTVGQFLDAWLEDVARAKVRPTTFVRYESIVRLHLVPQIGSRQLSKLGAEEINRAYQELSKT